MLLLLQNTVSIVFYTPRTHNLCTYDYVCKYVIFIDAFWNEFSLVVETTISIYRYTSNYLSKQKPQRITEFTVLT